MISFYFKIL